jgi:DNA-binding ferritin-like protein
MRLRRITNYPVTGFSAFSQQKTVFEPKFNEKTQTTELTAFPTTVNIVRFNNKQTGEVVDAEMSRDTVIVSTKATSDIEKAQELLIGR